MLTFFLVMALGAVIAVPVTDRILGFAIALYITATVRDGTPRARLATIALAPFVAFAATALAALLLEQPLAAAIAVPTIMFAVTWVAPIAPRYASLGIVALIAYITGLVTGQPPETLPVRLIVLLLAAGDAALIRGVLLRERPQAELHRLRHAIHGAIARVLGDIAAAVTAGRWTGGARAELRAKVYRLGEIILLAQGRVAALAQQLPDQGSRWLHLLEIELGTERVARVALHDLGSAVDRAPLLASLDALRHDGEPSPRASNSQLAAALSLLAHVLHEPPRSALMPAAAPPPVSTAPGLRPAFQAAIAAGLAIGAGNLISPNRWYWAAFAAFVMFQGTRSRAESIAKGLQFMAGTVAGVIVGMLLATLLSDHEFLSLAAIVAAVFLAFQANVAAYGVMVFWITVILGLLFGMLGYFTPDLLLLRLKEAVTGAACGALVATLVLVRRDRAATQDATIAFQRRALAPRRRA